MPAQVKKKQYGPKFILMMKQIVFTALICMLTAANAFAEDVSYDRYASLYTDREEPSLMSKVANDFLTYPFELIRWPVNQALIFAENRRIIDKGQYIYEKILDYGITPYIGLQRYGAEIDFIRLARQKVRFPDFTLKGWYDHYEGNTFTGARVGMERIGKNRGDSDARLYRHQLFGPAGRAFLRHRTRHEQRRRHLL
jgi:hypothetical protein